MKEILMIELLSGYPVNTIEDTDHKIYHIEK